jgi:hypothetical protein
VYICNCENLENVKNWGSKLLENVKKYGFENLENVKKRWLARFENVNDNVYSTMGYA